jgi:GT2 family glycosyltransferase
MNRAKTTRYLFENNFDLSVVIPFYKKLAVFEITLRTNHKFFQRNGIEVVIAMDEPSEQSDLLVLIKEYPLINWKVIVNEKKHEWRNPSKTLNVGIRSATKQFILVLGPDSEMATDLIFDMRRMAEFYQKCFFVGRVAFVDLDFQPSKVNVESQLLMYYGSIFIQKTFLLTVNGYDEAYEKWGGDDDNLRARLERFGLKKIKLPECIILHRESLEDLRNLRLKLKHSVSNRSPLELQNSFNPKTYLANSENWGIDFSKVIYDWQNNKYAENLCTIYLRKNALEMLEFKQGIFDRDYKVIALISVHNESHHLPDLLIHLENLCDGVILLDDASDDKTYNNAVGENLLLKVRKPYHEGFNDLSNRNILLDIASFIRSRFFFFIDADERFDSRYADLYSLVDSDQNNTICFNVVHLWNNENEFRVNVPEPSQIGIPGVVQRWRMFKNIGRMNISGSRLHFEATPYKAKKAVAPILIKHFGMIDKDIRIRKHSRYQLEDENLHLRPNKYQYFLDENIKVETVGSISLLSDIIYL